MQSTAFGITKRAREPHHHRAVVLVEDSVQCFSRADERTHAGVCTARRGTTHGCDQRQQYNSVRYTCGAHAHDRERAFAVRMGNVCTVVAGSHQVRLDIDVDERKDHRQRQQRHHPYQQMKRVDARVTTTERTRFFIHSQFVRVFAVY